MARVRLDRQGVGEVLQSAQMASAVNDAADQVAAVARAEAVLVEHIPGDIPVPIETSSYTTDRAAAAVSLAHPSGLAVQAKHGLLTRAASALGLDVTDRG